MASQAITENETLGSAGRSPAQAMLERMRANSVRFRELAIELDQAIDNIQRGREPTPLRSESGSSAQAAMTLFDGLEMLAKQDEATAKEMGHLVRELRDLF